jgi:hypothetical protein
MSTKLASATVQDALTNSKSFILWIINGIEVDVNTIIKKLSVKKGDYNTNYMIP